MRFREDRGRGWMLAGRVEMSERDFIEIGVYTLHGVFFDLLSMGSETSYTHDSVHLCHTLTTDLPDPNPAHISVFASTLRISA